MDLPWGDEKTKKFITNVGLVTSDGPNGKDIMACEWTHHVSYSPGLVVICLAPNHATTQNIRETKEFGICLAGVDQNILSSISGGSSGKDYDKIEALKEMGFSFYQGEKINVLMVKDTALSLELKLVQEVTLGDHVMLVGEVLDSKIGKTEPLGLHNGQYWKMTDSIDRVSQEVRDKNSSILEKHKK